MLTAQTHAADVAPFFLCNNQHWVRGNVLGKSWSQLPDLPCFLLFLHVFLLLARLRPKLFFLWSYLLLFLFAYIVSLAGLCATRWRISSSSCCFLPVSFVAYTVFHGNSSLSDFFFVFAVAPAICAVFQFVCCVGEMPYTRTHSTEGRQECPRDTCRKVMREVQTKRGDYVSGSKNFTKRNRYVYCIHLGTPRSPIIGHVSWYWITHFSLGTWQIQKLLKEKL